MPRVGSSTISTAGLAAEPFGQHDLLLVAARKHGHRVGQAAVLDLQPGRPVGGERALGGRRMSPAFRSLPSEASATFCWTDMSMTRPCCRRSSGTNPIPAAIAAGRRCPAQACPRTVTAPGVVAVDAEDGPGHLAAARATRPASATISPARTCSEMSVKTPSRVSRSTPQHLSPGAARGHRRRASGSSRPTMARTRSSAVRPPSVVGHHVPAVAHHGYPLADREDLLQPVRDEQHRRALRAQCPRSRRTAASTSAADSAAVGSSITMTRALQRERLGRSRRPAGRRWTARGRAGPGRAARRGARRSLAASCASRRQSIRRPGRSGWRPMKMFSATVRSGNSVGSW